MNLLDWLTLGACSGAPILANMAATKLGRLMGRRHREASLCCALLSTGVIYLACCVASSELSHFVRVSARHQPAADSERQLCHELQSVLMAVREVDYAH